MAATAPLLIDGPVKKKRKKKKKKTLSLHLCARYGVAAAGSQESDFTSQVPLTLARSEAHALDCLALPNM